MSVTLPTVHSPPRSPPQPPQVLRTAAADIRRNDQVAFVSPDGPDGDGAAHVAGEVTGMRHDPRGSTVYLVVENRVHVVPRDHGVIIVRGATA